MGSLTVRYLVAAVTVCLWFIPPVYAIGTLPTGFTEEQVIGGLTQPVGFAFLPDARVIVVEQKNAGMNTADIELVRMQPSVASATIFTVPDVRTAGGEQGLLGVAVDPGWPTRPYLYVYFDHTPGSFIYIRRYTASGALTDPTSLSIGLADPYNILTDIPDVQSNHNGGTVHFGTDGMLYASLGEDADFCNAQTLSLMKGRILRLDVSGLPAGAGGPPAKALITPADNPFVGDPSENARLVWAYGLRNPFRFTVDPWTGYLYIADVGQNLWEEMDEARMGGINFGWPKREGAHTYAAGAGCPGTNGTDPILEYNRSGFTASIIAGPLYRPVAGPAGIYDFPYTYYGDVFFLEYYQGFIRRYKQTSPGVWALADSVPGQPSASNWASGITNVSDMQTGPDGAIWYVKQSPGALRRIRGTPSSSVGGPSTLAAPAPGASLAVSPNPLRDSSEAEVRYTTPASGKVAVQVYTVSGERVATLFRGELAAGAHVARWDGRDARGGDAPTGVYFVRVEWPGGSLAQKITLAR